MEQAFVSFLMSPAILPVLVAGALILLESYWQIPERFQPLLFVRLLGIRMLEKAASKPKASKQKELSSRQTLLGAFSLLLITLPWLLILYFMNQFSYIPLFFDACILLFCLQFSHVKKRCHRIQNALKLNKKQLGKDLLSKIVLRDTQPLSKTGISKGALEALQLKFYYQQLCVVFWFIVAGPFFALFYTMTLELNYAWNIKKQNQQTFGRASYTVCHWMQWIPVRLACILTLIFSRGLATLVSRSPKGGVIALLQMVFASNGKIILATQSIASQLTFSGAVMYDGVKVRREKFIALREPNSDDLPLILSIQQRTLLAFFAVMLVTNSLIQQVFTFV